MSDQVALESPGEKNHDLMAENFDFETNVDWSRFKRPTPQWFQDSPLGIFIHWGAYSVPAFAEPIGPLGSMDLVYYLKHCPYSEWYFNTVRIPGSVAQKHHAEVYGNRPYDDFLDEWKAENFDASKWAELFAEAGASYVIPTTKHHDGITLWDAPETGDRNTVQRGPKRDLVGEIGEAVRSQGMKFGVYYSGGLDWHISPGEPIDGTSGPDDLPRPLDFAYGSYAARHCIDLIKKYQPSILWNDIEWPDETKLDDSVGSLAHLFTTYYNAVPDGLVNDRWGVPHKDYATSEYEMHLDRQKEGAWEHCRGMGFSFGYNAVEDEGITLNGHQVARELTDIVSRGGRMLINVGPKANGEIPEMQQRTLRDLGVWMQSAKPLLSGAKVASEVPETSEGWVRWLDRDTELVAVLDVVDAENPKSVLPGEIVISGLNLSQPEGISILGSAEVTSATNSEVHVKLGVDRIGPVLLRIPKAAKL